MSMTQTVTATRQGASSTAIPRAPARRPWPAWLVGAGAVVVLSAVLFQLPGREEIAPRVQADQAICTPDIVYRSVLATYRAGGRGVIFAPNYASMKLTNLDGAARALTELGLK